MQDVTEMKIYQNALKLLKPIYCLVNLLPKDEFDLKNQTFRAAKSIAPLIAEGFAKKSSQQEFKRFLMMALGSCDEVITHLRQIKIIGFNSIKQETCDGLIYFYKIESKQINSCIQTIKQQSEIRNLNSDV